MSEMTATITTDYLNDDNEDQGLVFILSPGEGMAGRAQKRKFNAYDDDGILYYEIVAVLADDAAYAGVTRLDDITGDGEDWSAS